MSGFQDYLPTCRYMPALAFSPDGGQIAYSCNTSGQYNLWCQPVDGGAAVALTDYTDHSVREVAWSPDGGSIVYTADHHGDEFHQIYRVAATGGQSEKLTDAPKAQHFLGMESFSPDGTRLIYAGNDREPTLQDLLVRDLGSGEVTRIPGETGLELAVSYSPDGSRLLMLRATSNTNMDLYLLAPDGTSEPVHLTPHEGDAAFEPGAWAADGSGFWLITDHGRELPILAFQRLDGTFAPGALEPVYESAWGLERMARASESGTVVWTVNEDGYSRLHARDGNGVALPVPAIPDGVVSALRISPDGRRVAMLLATAIRPAEVALLDLDTGTFRYLTDSRPAGFGALRPVAPELIRYPTHDGRDIPAYLYRPAGDGPFPVVLSIHGGPEAQERTAYNYGGFYQYLLANGVGVLAPNVRGSTGYGRSYQKLIHHDWGGAELGDFDYAVRYLRTLDWVDADRLGVFGGSFGGFATLSCVSRLPDLWAAAVSVVGPSNLVTFAKAVPPTWRALMVEWVGDPETEVDFLMERSPISYADAIRAPLFVIQGAKDPRVVQAESDQIVASLRERGVDVRYDVYPDEGHGFTKRENELRAIGDSADFLITHLKGSAA
ncbi:MAG TPA: prolyl oligopeptidase family serine peptidase [Mycobacteriales bacterium]|nr:prolyl oligopeptidase family serine peptidase [Mycobacteriales bacterium]